MAPIVVEPEALAGAGVSVSGVADELAGAVSALAAGLPSGAMAGHDRAGLAFGQAYQQAAQALLNAGGAAVDGGRKVGFGVQMSATNYSHADVSSTIGGGATALAPPEPPGAFDAPSVPSPFGGGVAEPFLWSMVQMLVGDVWPDGDPAQLRAAAGAWQSFATTLTGIAGQLEGPSATIAGQQVPEGGAMASALSDWSRGLSDIASESGKLATQVFEFAADVEATQNAIRDLLGRLSPAGLLDGIGALLSGDALDELKEIAEDIRTVLDNLKRQADSRQQSMQDVMQMIDGAVVSLEQKARKEFTHYLGEDVGNAAATVFDFQLNLREGILKGGIGALEDIQQLNPLRFAYDFDGAKDTWGGMLDTNFNASLVGQIIDPERAAQTQKEMLQGAVHAEDWTTDRSGLGLGQNIFDVGSAVVGGAGAARAGTRAAGEAAEGAAPAVRAAGALDNAVTDTSAIAGSAGRITDNLDDIGDNIPPGATGVPSGPAIPPSLAEPPSARVADAPRHQPPDTLTPHGTDSAPVDRSPADHSPTSTSTPAQTPAGPGNSPPHAGTTPIGGVPESRVPVAVDAPSDPHQSVPGPAASSVSAAGSDPPDPTLVGADASPSQAGHMSGSMFPDETAPKYPDGPGDDGGSRTPRGPGSGGGESGSVGGSDNNGVSGDSDGHGDSSTSKDRPTDPVHSHELSGDGWHRLDDGPLDPDYGEPLSEHWPFDDDPVGHARINPDVGKLVEDPAAPFGRAPDGHAYSMTEYAERFNLISPKGDHYQNFPPNDGAMPGTKVAFNDFRAFVDTYGNQLDRIGENGKYLAVMENGIPATWESRAMHVESIRSPYNIYGLDHLPEGWKIEASEVGPGCGQPGGSIQIRIIDVDDQAVPVDILKELGVLE